MPVVAAREDDDASDSEDEPPARGMIPGAGGSDLL